MTYIVRYLCIHYLAKNRKWQFLCGAGSNFQHIDQFLKSWSEKGVDMIEFVWLKDTAKDWWWVWVQVELEREWKAKEMMRRNQKEGASMKDKLLLFGNWACAAHTQEVRGLESRAWIQMTCELIPDQLCSPVLWLWAIYLASLSFCFLTLHCKKENILLSSRSGYT